MRRLISGQASSTSIFRQTVPSLSRVGPAIALLVVLTPALAQRPLCNQLPAFERDRARAAGLCRDPAPIIDVAPMPGPAESEGAVAPATKSTARSLAVPNVVGLNFDEARNRLTRFTLQRSYRAAAEPGGTVLTQAPMAPATLPAGAPVSLVLSDGSLVRVPRVTNMNINEARQRLQKEIDLKPQPVVVTSDMRVGTVIEQQPAEGTLVKRNSVVRLQVSAGPEGPELIDVPNVVGMSFDRAKARLVRFSVERLERPTREPTGQIIEQAPRAATRAAVGSVIVLTVASAPRAAIEVFEMPNVVGRSGADAARALNEFQVARTEVDSAAPRDQIVAQTPAAGSTLMPGDAVALQLSAGPKADATAATSSNESSAAPGAPSPRAASGRAVLAIGASVVLGLIIGALVMRQWLLRRRATVETGDTSTSPGSLQPHGITSVDILLEDEAAARPADVDPAAEPQEKKPENNDAQEQGSRPGP